MTDDLRQRAESLAADLNGTLGGLNEWHRGRPRIRREELVGFLRSLMDEKRAQAQAELDDLESEIDDLDADLADAEAADTDEAGDTDAHGEQP